MPADTCDQVPDKLQKAWDKLQPWCTKYARALLRTHWKLTDVVANAAVAPPTQVETTEGSSEAGEWYRVSLREKYIKFIKNGAKTVEGRVARGRMLRIR